MEKKEKNKYSVKSIINKIILGLAITIFILLLIIFLTTDINEIKNAFSRINIGYLFAAIGLTLLYFALSPITLCMLTKRKKCDINMLDTYLIGNTEHFFNGITPFATGGQPFQVYSFSRLGVKASASTGILIMNFIIHMFVTNLFALLSLAIYPKLVTAVGSLLPVVIIGFVMNFLSFAIVLLLATSKKVANFLVLLLTKLGKIKFLSKVVNPSIEGFKKYCEDTQSAFKELFKYKWTALGCFIVRAITMFVYYAITFYVLRAFNIAVSYTDLFFVICGTSFAITACVFIPTPGGSGGIEFAFTSIFVFIASGITKDLGASGMLLWRILTYYGLMLLSFIFYLILEKRTTKYEKTIKLANNLQLEQENEMTDTESNSQDSNSDLTNIIDIENNSLTENLDINNIDFAEITVPKEDNQSTITNDEKQ